MRATQKEIKNARTLLTKKGRRANKQFLTEGVRLLEESLRYRRLPETVYYVEPGLSDRGRTLVNQFRSLEVTSFEVSPKQLEMITGTETSQGIAAVFGFSNLKLAESYRKNFRKILLLEDISDPGNLGTLVRSALAFKFDMVISCGRSAEFFSPKVVRSSVGAIFGLRLATSDLYEIARMKEQNKWLCVGTSAGGDSELPKVSTIDSPLVLMIGSEATGLSTEAAELTDRTVSVKHGKAVESLNAAIAGSILMSRIYEER